MHSRPIAEPLSIVAGALGGITARYIAKKAMQSMDAPEIPTEFVGVLAAGLGHYLVNQTVDVAVSAGLLDPIGGAVGTVTSPLEATVHAFIVAAAELIKAD
jgi:hypothetical protein